MTWIVAGVAWIIIASAFGVALGRMAAPQTEAERRADDEAQIEWLRRYYTTRRGSSLSRLAIKAVGKIRGLSRA